MEIEDKLTLDNGKEVHLNANVKFYDDGIGKYEMWGHVGYDKKTGYDIISASHDEDLTDSERKEVEEYLESREFYEKVGEIVSCY